MFLHLFFSLAMHEIIFKNKSNYVAPLLIIDQPSRPYYGSNGIRIKSDIHNDDKKIHNAFELLNNFMNNRINEGGNFQMIVIEHINKDMVSDLNHVHIVDTEFREGNALIPKSYLTN